MIIINNNNKERLAGGRWLVSFCKLKSFLFPPYFYMSYIIPHHAMTRKCIKSGAKAVVAIFVSFSFTIAATFTLFEYVSCLEQLHF